MAYLALLLEFIISGIIVVAATLVAKQVDPKWSGLIVAAPLLSLLTYFFLSYQKEAVAIKQYLLAALLFMVPAAVFLGSLYLFSGKVPLGLNLLIGALLFSVVVFLVQGVF